MSSLETGLEQHLLRCSTTTAIAKDQHVPSISLEPWAEDCSEAIQHIMYLEPDKKPHTCTHHQHHKTTITINVL